MGLQTDQRMPDFGYSTFGHDLALNKGYDTAGDVKEKLETLLWRLQEYDRIRLQLENEGGDMRLVETLTQVLNEPMVFRHAFGKTKVTLTDPGSIESFIGHIGSYDLHLDIRNGAYGFPCYYICRIKKDFWSEYSLIIEDLYQSSGYPKHDRRFAKLMHFGHEYYFLRLSDYMEKTRKMLGKEAPAYQTSADHFLYKIGRYVFQAAWHEDQRAGILCAENFGLVEFAYAIELLYLCLGGDLCGLRSQIDKTMLQFFEQVYVQPQMYSFLIGLKKMEGKEINEIPHKALKLYRDLTFSFGCFLKTEVVFGARLGKIPLYKLIFANMVRMDLIKDKLSAMDQVIEGKEKLEQRAHEVINQFSS